MCEDRRFADAWFIIVIRFDWVDRYGSRNSSSSVRARKIGPSIGTGVFKPGVVADGGSDGWKHNEQERKLVPMREHTYSTNRYAFKAACRAGRAIIRIDD